MTDVFQPKYFICTISFSQKKKEKKLKAKINPDKWDYSKQSIIVLQNLTKHKFCKNANKRKIHFSRNKFIRIRSEFFNFQKILLKCLNVFGKHLVILTKLYEDFVVKLYSTYQVLKIGAA